MDRTDGRARRRQLFAAVSVLGVSLGMADAAHAAKDDAAQTQGSHKGRASLKIEASRGQHSIKGEGQSSLKIEQSSHKVQNSYKEQGPYKEQSSYKVQGSYKQRLPPPGQSSIKGEANQ